MMFVTLWLFWLECCHSSLRYVCIGNLRTLITSYILDCFDISWLHLWEWESVVVVWATSMVSLKKSTTRTHSHKALGYAQLTSRLTVSSID